MKRVALHRVRNHHDLPGRRAIEQLAPGSRPPRISGLDSSRAAAPVEICHLPPGPGNGRTYTSHRPVSFEAYASQRPSGENIDASSADGVARKVVGRPGFHPDASL